MYIFQEAIICVLHVPSHPAVSAPFTMILVLLILSVKCAGACIVLFSDIMHGLHDDSDNLFV